MSLCEKEGEYNKYDLNIKKSKCQCYTKIKILSFSEIKNK